MGIEDVLNMYRSDLLEVERWMLANLTSEVKLIAEVGGHIIGGGGKRIRPLMLLSVAAACGGGQEARYPLAAVIEFIHTASLLHDDVIDNAETRRGRVSANHIWGNQASILVGDYLYARSFDLMTQYGNQRVIKCLARATTAMAEGEVFQLTKVGDIGISEADYLKIIEGKTAVLISAACEIGAIIGGAGEEEINRFARFGYATGMAFQIVDDALDYTAKEENLGKSLGKDLAEGKITLPLICALSRGTGDEKERVKEIIRKSTRDESDFRWIKGFIDNHEGIAYAMKRARDFIEEAKQNLPPLSPSPAVSALYLLADYIVLRGN
ncbi:MAG TPA: polyprenyl synthetase family protein [Syntrophales bacterium]|nr:polyprenyl synthetase family protein [Syntrophales bacterium]HOL59167.1 polyprenyl synthetase family protein [Syntrophales bacterium]HPO35752.1 polyprenyl synthetase family protein [Syntrophales bacterium]